MTLGTLEIISLIVIILVFLKLIMLLIAPKAWFKPAEKMFKNVMLAQIVCLILAGILFYFLYTAGVTVVQILAIMLLMSMLLGAGLAPYVTKMIKEMNPKEILKSHLNWLLALVWLALLIWGVKEIFF
ncbi:MAG: hypothetical protein ABIG93_02345 [archaeon]|nr:hypothetical protein [Nanoarchaeota archaeon]